MPYIAIFDIGKTNKKCFVFNEDYRIVFEKSEQLPETKDEDGDPCEDVHLLAQWVRSSLQEVLQMPDFQVKAVNFSAYGASFVYLDEQGGILTPLYNYLKPYPEKLSRQFYEKYGGEEKVAGETASPVLGSLNSGLQLYRLKYEQPNIFNRLKYALHLPQYVSYLISKEFYSEITSIGCHTNLWNFEKSDYHDWVYKESIFEKLAPIHQSPITSHHLLIGTGLHDSSAALIPYLASFHKPFVLLSTGTWNIAMNPFNQTPLTPVELAQDCLCYLSYQGSPVKASRLFAGHEHEQAVKRMGLENAKIKTFGALGALGEVGKSYLLFLKQLVEKQAVAINLVLDGAPVQRLFVDGGFSKNEIFMTLLAEAFPGLEVYAAEVAQASALGAAMAMHEHWNGQPLPENLVKCKRI